VRNKLILSIFFVGLAIFSPLTNAWNAVGHMVIAKIAYDQLTPEVRNKVDALVVNLATEYPEIKNFTQMAPWPDQLRAQKIDSYTHWHYIDNAFSTDGTALKNLSDTDNVLWAIDKIKPVLQNEQANPYERARFLAFLVHIVGDIHQPLHTVSRISLAHPDGDQGGNLFVVNMNLPAHKKTPSNLHRVWDEGLGFFVGGDSMENIAALAEKITATYPKNYFGNQISDINLKDWTDEGMNSASSFVYNTLEGQVLSAAYIADGQAIAEQKAALAGYRLAELLNKLF
jgi:hypothetical protein